MILARVIRVMEVSQDGIRRLNFLTALNRASRKPQGRACMGKIYRDELQEMLKDGQSQADCARHFQVSEAAICKAVKRLKAMEIPESFVKLTEKQRAFVVHRASGENATQSALAAYDCKTLDVAKTMGAACRRTRTLRRPFLTSWRKRAYRSGEGFKD